MPGSGFKMRCSGCETVHEISTGVSWCPEHHEEWIYEQYVCPSCLTLKSRQTPYCCREEGLVCEVCVSELAPWTGRVWHEQTPDGLTGPEHVDGPCPQCGQIVSEKD